MSWFSTLTLLAKLAYSLTTYVQERQLLSAGEARAVAEGLRRSADALSIANRAEAEADVAHKAHPDDDAGFDPDLFRKDE